MEAEGRSDPYVVALIQGQAAPEGEWDVLERHQFLVERGEEYWDEEFSL